MSGWQIILVVCLVLFLIGQIRIGADVQYGQEGPQVKLRLGAFKITLLPGKPGKKEDKPQKEQKPRKAKKAAKKKKDGDDDSKEKKRGMKLTLDQILDLAREFVPLLLEAAGCFWSKLVMDVLEISVIIGSRDPADAALLYGRVHAAMGAVWKPLNEAFHVKEGRGHVGVDFESESMTLYVHIALSIKIGQIIWLAGHYSMKAMGRFLHYQKIQNAKQEDRKAV